MAMGNKESMMSLRVTSGCKEMSRMVLNVLFNESFTEKKDGTKASVANCLRK